MGRAGRTPRRVALWMCRCICGIRRPVAQSSLIKGLSNSCGCLRTELKAQRNRDAVLPLSTRFWSKVNKHGPKASAQAARVHPEIASTQCWEWTGSKSSNGYGEITIKGKIARTHRTAWALATGKPPTKQVLHKCDNRKCVRKLHLFEGTAKQNSQDMHAKGRGRKY